MGWLRSHRRGGAWLALLALVLQLGLAFGHIHTAHSGNPAAVISAGALPTDTGDQDRDDYCATCAILALLTGAQTASAPIVPAPAVLTSAEIAIPRASARVAILRAAFQSRAPPLT